MKILLLCSFVIGASLHIYAREEMPIIAFIGVDNDRSTDRNFKDFHDCGFNVSLHNYSSLKQLVEACNIARKYGVRILGECPQTHQQPEYAAQMLKDNKGFFGYVLQDEPSANDIMKRQGEIARLQKNDKGHCFYINLHPYYGKWSLDFTKTTSYGAYLDVASQTSCAQISFDYYPVTKDSLRQGWFRNLEMIRAMSKKCGKPFWGFVLCTPHAVYPQPTMGSLRLQVYTNLAYGAQAIEYFTYWTPAPTKQWDFHNGPVTLDGRKTETYYLVRKMNRELRKIAPLFYGAKVTAVSHLGVIPPGTTRLSATPVNIKRIITKGRCGAVVSQFTKGGHRYMAVVNKDYNDSMGLHIEKKCNAVRKVNTDLSLQAMASDYRIPPGGVIIFRLR